MNNNKFEANKKYFTICIYTVFVIFASAVIFRLILNWEQTQLIVTRFFTTLSPFFIGFLIAYMVNPFTKLLYNKVFVGKLALKKHERIKKVLCILISYLVVFGFIITCLIYIIPQVITSLTDLTDRIPDLYNTVVAWANQYAVENPSINNETMNKLVQDNLPDVFTYVKNLLTGLIPLLYTASISVVKWFVNILIALVISIYMMSDKSIIINSVKRIIYAFFTVEKSKVIIQTLKECNSILSGFIIGKSIDSLIIGILCFIFMSIFQLPYTMLISVIVGITNMIPYFGPYIGGIPGVIILLITNPVKGLIFGILIIVLQQFDGLILGPKILGDSTGLRPIGILLAITVGGAYAGVLGMFLGVPVLAVILHLFNKYIDRKLKTKNLSTNP